MAFFFPPSKFRRLPAFSVGEVVIAAFVLTVGILSVVGLIANSYRQSSESQKLIVASELAQEGIELVRNVRDNQIASKANDPSAVNNVLDSLFGLSNKNQCRIDYDSGISCAPGSAMGLKLVNNFYNHDGAGTDQFYRRIKIDGNTTDGIRVYSFVTWISPNNNINTGTPAAAIGSCTLATSCVYAEHLLTPWK